MSPVMSPVMRAVRPVRLYGIRRCGRQPTRRPRRSLHGPVASSADSPVPSSMFVSERRKLHNERSDELFIATSFGYDRRAASARDTRHTRKDGRRGGAPPGPRVRGRVRPSELRPPWSDRTGSRAKYIGHSQSHTSDTHAVTHESCTRFRSWPCIASYTLSSKPETSPRDANPTNASSVYGMNRFPESSYTYEMSSGKPPRPPF